MLLPPRLTAHPALMLATLPLVAGVGSALALLPFVGRGQAWHMVSTAGPYSALMVGAVLGVVGVLCTLLRTSPSAQPAPLVVLVGLATLPWFLGIAGTQEAMEKVLAALPRGEDREAVLAVLVPGTGEAMVTRMLGAWMSAGLLVSVALGLVLQQGRAVLGGRQSGRLLGAALGLALGCTALLVAIEAHHLFELLTTLATRAPEARAGLIAASGARLARLYELRSATLGALGVVALALVAWQFFLRPEAISQWVGSLVLAALAATVLFLDARPLQLTVHVPWQLDASRPEVTPRVRDVLVKALSAVPPVTGVGSPP